MTNVYSTGLENREHVIRWRNRQSGMSRVYNLWLVDRCYVGRGRAGNQHWGESPPEMYGSVRR